MAGQPAHLPYGTQWVDDEDIAAVVDVLRHGHLTQGPKVAEFERALAESVHARYCVSFSNATVALHSAIAALNLPQGSSGLTSPNTFVASANCMAYSGVRPDFADIDPRTYNVTADSLESRISEKTAVLVPVHFAGQPADMAGISEVARRHDLAIVEDAAHAIGSRYADGDPVGSCRHSAMTVFSFHPVKTMTTGEGGAVTTNDAALHGRLQLLRSHGITRDPARLTAQPGPWYYEMIELGFNYRLTDLQCALGITQLAKLQRFMRRRREIVGAYNRAFAAISAATIPFEAPGLDSCFHLYVLAVDFARIGKTRSQVMQQLADRGVGSQVHYIPVHLQPWYRKNFGYGPGYCPVAEAYYERALSLPLFPRMSDDDVSHVITSVAEVLQ